MIIYLLATAIYLSIKLNGNKKGCEANYVNFQSIVGYTL